MAKHDKVEVVKPVEEVVAEVVAAVVEEVPAKADKRAIEPLAVVEGQLHIYENRVINVPEGARVTVVENLGFGDLYVDNTGIQFTSNYCVSPGEKKEYKGAKVVFLGSASRPDFRVSFYK